jgi:gamma-glutamylputrescine oxidase
VRGEFARSAALNEARRIAGDCYYEHTVARPAQRAPLAGSCEADVVVVGGGLAGLSCALELTQRGLKVVVLEAQRVAGGASGRNGGQVLPGYSSDIDVIARQIGADGARRAWDWSIEGMRIVRERAAAIDGGCDFTPGWLYLAARASHVAGLRDWYRALRERYGYGENVEFLEGVETRKWSSSPHYHAVIVDHFAGHLNPLKLVLGMVRSLEAGGAQIFEGSGVERIERGSTVTLRTAQGQVRARHAVLAANVFIDGLGVSVARRVMPVSSTIIATEPLDPSLVEGITRERYSACDSNFLLDYYRITPDRRMLWGGGSSYLRHDPIARAAGLRQRMVQHYPVLAAARIDYTWSGLIDVTISRAPDFGRIDENLLYLQGFSGHGLNTTALAGRLAAEAVQGSPARFDELARLSHRNFPGGPLLRRTALELGTWYYRARDWLAR